MKSNLLRKKKGEKMIPRYFTTFDVPKEGDILADGTVGKNYTFEELYHQAFFDSVMERSSTKCFCPLGEFKSGTGKIGENSVIPNGLLAFSKPVGEVTVEQLRRKIILMQARMNTKNSHIAMAFVFNGFYHFLYAPESFCDEQLITDMIDEIADVTGLDADDIEPELMIGSFRSSILNSMFFVQNGYMMYKNCNQKWIDTHPSSVIIGI